MISDSSAMARIALNFTLALTARRNARSAARPSPFGVRPHLHCMRRRLAASPRVSIERRLPRPGRSCLASFEPGAEVPDPYYGGPEGFERVFDICLDACRGLLAHLRELYLLEP